MRRNKFKTQDRRELEGKRERAVKMKQVESARLKKGIRTNAYAMTRKWTTDPSSKTIHTQEKKNTHNSISVKLRYLYGSFGIVILLFVFSTQRNSFQAVIATDGCESFSLFNYDSSMHWGTTLVFNRAVIGVSDGEALTQVHVNQVLREENVVLFHSLAECAGARLLRRQCLATASAIPAVPTIGVCPDTAADAELDKRYRQILLDDSRLCYINSVPRRGTNVVSLLRFKFITQLLVY